MTVSAAQQRQHLGAPAGAKSLLLEDGQLITHTGRFLEFEVARVFHHLLFELLDGFGDVFLTHVLDFGPLQRSLIQTIGRAARNLHGRAILYADRMTDSMTRAIGETERRRAKQLAHNEAMGITPRSIVKQVRDLIDGVYSEKAGKEAERLELAAVQRAKVEEMSEKDISKAIKQLEKQMMEHAKNLDFEKAAQVRDQLQMLKAQAFGAPGTDNVVVLKA